MIVCDIEIKVAEFVENGYTIIRNAISSELIESTQNSIKEVLVDNLANKNTPINKALSPEETFWFCLKHKEHEESFYDFQIPIWNFLKYKNYPVLICREPIIMSFLGKILGLDLCYQSSQDLTINTFGHTSSSNYLIKEFHQEVWSGNSHNTIQFWTPLIHEKATGQLCLVPGSHSWGHVPHQNRKPIGMPSKFATIESDLEYGDVIFFHSLTLHKTAEFKKPSKARLALPMFVKNFRDNSSSFEHLRDYSIFNLSPLSVIEKKLGNPSLSPFRLSGKEHQFNLK